MKTKITTNEKSAVILVYNTKTVEKAKRIQAKLKDFGFTFNTEDFGKETIPSDKMPETVFWADVNMFEETILLNGIIKCLQGTIFGEYVSNIAEWNLKQHSQNVPVGGSLLLPSDEEIKNAAPSCPDADRMDIQAHNWFIAGAKWYRTRMSISSNDHNMKITKLYYYEVSYYHEAESDKCILTHEKEYTQEQFDELVANCTVKAFKTKGDEYGKSVEYLFERAIKILEDEFGFKQPTIKAKFFPYGGGNIDEPKAWYEPESTQLDLVRLKFAKSD